MDQAKPRAHFLHLGKTGGTAIKGGLWPVRSTGPYELVLHDHKTTLRDLEHGEPVFFAVRDPIERFVSGFYSRQRQGRPRYRSRWSSMEERAFRRFETADALARALSSASADEREEASTAMREIQHVRDSYWRWFDSPEYFASRSEDLLAILWQPSLTGQFGRVCEMLGLPNDIELPTDDVGAHRNPAHVDRALSEEATANLANWYAADFSFLATCRSLPCFMSGTWT